MHKGNPTLAMQTQIWNIQKATGTMTEPEREAIRVATALLKQNISADDAGVIATTTMILTKMNVTMVTVIPTTTADATDPAILQHSDAQARQTV